ncbi:MAG: hypothetical protein ACLQEQ_07770 [Nitrososphaerales archaeon]
MTEGLEAQRVSFDQIRAGLALLGIDVALIGSVGAGRASAHDIDILVLRPESTPQARRQILTFFQPFTSCDITDWRGYFIRGTRFGAVEVYFLDMLMESAANPGPLRLMKVILRSLNSYFSVLIGGPRP